MEKWAAVVKYVSGTSTGAVVTANSQAEAWQKILTAFNGGENVASIEMAMVLTEEKGCL